MTAHIQPEPAGAETLPKKEAAEFLGCKPRTLDRRWEEWGLTKVPVEGKHGQETHYQVRELERVRESLPPIQMGRPRGSTEAGKAQVQALAPVLQHGIEPALRALFAPLIDELRAQLPPAKPSAKPSAQLSELLTLSVAQAAALSGFSREAIRAAIHKRGKSRLKAQQLPGRRGFTIKRHDLDEWVKNL